jgi:hypothetical protein
MSLEQQLKIKFFEDYSSDASIESVRKEILGSISNLERRRILIRTSIWSIFAFISSFGLLASGVSFYQQFVNSGVRELIAIGLTDTSIIITNGTDFFYSLAESLPIGNIAAGLAATAALLYSLRHLVELQLNNLSKKIYGYK